MVVDERSDQIRIRCLWLPDSSAIFRGLRRYLVVALALNVYGQKLEGLWI